MSEFAAYYQTLQASSNLTLLGALLLVNSIISALVAAETIRHLPYREPRQRRLLWLLIFLCGLFVPLLGSLGAALAMLGGMRWQTAAGRASQEGTPKPAERMPET
jgi:purine-cytosine permease-like protein